MNRYRCILLTLLPLLLVMACSSKRSLVTGGLFPIVMRPDQWGYIDKSGTIVINPQFRNASFFFEDLAAASPDGKKFGYIDKSGNFVINPQFDEARPFSEGLAAVVMGPKLGFVDKTGTVVITPQFEPYQREIGVALFSEGLAAVKTGENCGFIDKAGSFVINPQFKACFPFYDSLAAVQVGDTWGYVDRTGKLVINPQFDKAFPFTSGLGLVKSGTKYGYVDKSGQYKINPQFDTATPFSDEGIAGVRVGDRWGGIDTSGKLVINPQFNGNSLDGFDARLITDVLARDIGRVTFSEGLAPVKIGDKSGYIDRSGHFVINPQFDLALPFIDGLALVTKGRGPDAELGWIDKTGKYVWKR